MNKTLASTAVAAVLAFSANAAFAQTDTATSEMTVTGHNGDLCALGAVTVTNEDNFTGASGAPNPNVTIDDMTEADGTAKDGFVRIRFDGSTYCNYPSAKVELEATNCKILAKNVVDGEFDEASLDNFVGYIATLRWGGGTGVSDTSSGPLGSFETGDDPCRIEAEYGANQSYLRVDIDLQPNDQILVADDYEEKLTLTLGKIL